MNVGDLQFDNFFFLFLFSPAPEWSELSGTVHMFRVTSYTVVTNLMQTSTKNVSLFRYSISICGPCSSLRPIFYADLKK